MLEISKKDLLEEMGISYGQLYRWKREKLIPEEWFVKRSAITGQETYFPREQILDRIEAIIELKEGHSLEEIRNILASEHSVLLGKRRIESLDILPKDFFERTSWLRRRTDFKRAEIAFMLLLNEIAEERELADNDFNDLLERGLPLLDDIQSAHHLVFVVDVQGKIHLILAKEDSHPFFDSGMTLVRSVSLIDLAARLKIGRSGEWVSEEIKAGSE